MTQDPTLRVVSLVPSWTETLISAGVNVVGRTRFCIHPRSQVTSIPIVGGTKNIDGEKLAAVRPDLVVLDRDENPRSLTDHLTAPWIATHITSVSDVARELRALHDRIGASTLRALAERWDRTCAQLKGRSAPPNLSALPGIVGWIRKPGPLVDRFLYLIWKDPWRAAGTDTFIGSVFELLGFAPRIALREARYPEIDLADFDSDRTLLLFSSEPYPFHPEKDRIREMPFASALVDGEAYSWFGIRALRFLEGCVAGRQ
jgi:hypothetical protein